MTNIYLPHICGLFNASIAFPPLLDEVPLGILVLNKERQIVLMNRALEALTGFVRQEAKGISCSYILRCDICLQNCPILNMKEASEPVCLEGNLINRDRRKVLVRITASPIEDAEGNVVGYLEAVEDIGLLHEGSGKIAQTYGFDHLVGRSSQIERIFQILPGIAQTDSSVLITGETGTGKDVLAQAIHRASNRAKGPFIKVNCGALPESLLESELFGHHKGAFTGAVENKPGRFRLAHNGTLYLTEIGDLPLSLQVKLLTFLDDKVVYPLGSTKGFQADVRVIAATHRNLEQMVRDGRFRADLLFRLNVIRLHVPPLRERGDDMRLLLNHFLHLFTVQFRKPIKGFSNRAMGILLSYPYPGNIRELRNIVEYMVNICQEEQIQPHHLPAYLTQVRPVEEPEEKEGQPSFLNLAPNESQENLDLNWATIERKMIMEALLKAKGRRTKAAALLGWGRSTLWRKMKQYGIDE